MPQTLSTEGIPTVDLFDTIVDFSQPIKYAVHKSASNTKYSPYAANSYDTSSITFNLIPPNKQSLMDGRIAVKGSFRLTFTATANINFPNQNILDIGVTDALRAWPLQKLVSTMSLQLGNTSMNAMNSTDIINSLGWFILNDEETISYSRSPKMLDQSQTYVELLNSIRNPLGNYESSPQTYFQEPRGTSNYYNVISNTPTSAVVDCFITEELIIPPLSISSKGDSYAFSYLDKVELQLTLSQDYTKIWSHANYAASPTITNITMAWNRAPQALVSFLNRDPIQLVPPMLNYEYLPITRQSKINVATNVPPGDFPNTVINDAITLNSIPKLLYIWVQPNTSSMSYAQKLDQPDCYASIRQISLTFNNFSSSIGSAEQEQLYQMSVNNGLRMSFDQFSKRVGSILCLEFGKDIPLIEPTLAQGVLGTFQLQFQLQCTNISSSVKSYDLYYAYIEQGLLQISETQQQTFTGLLDKNIVLDTRDRINYHHLRSIYGGNFFGKVKSFFKSALPVAAKVAKAIAPVLESIPQTQALAPIAKYIGQYEKGGTMKKKKISRKMLLE